jgi:hypothetical protein
MNSSWDWQIELLQQQLNQKNAPRVLQKKGAKIATAPASTHEEADAFLKSLESASLVIFKILCKSELWFLNCVVHSKVTLVRPASFLSFFEAHVYILKHLWHALMTVKHVMLHQHFHINNAAIRICSQFLNGIKSIASFFLKSL